MRRPARRPRAGHGEGRDRRAVHGRRGGARADHGGGRGNRAGHSRGRSRPCRSRPGTGNDVHRLSGPGEPMPSHATQALNTPYLMGGGREGGRGCCRASSRSQRRVRSPKSAWLPHGGRGCWSLEPGQSKHAGMVDSRWSMARGLQTLKKPSGYGRPGGKGRKRRVPCASVA